MRVLGIDPGLTRCGLGVVESDGSQRLNLVDVGVFQTSRDEPLEVRLMQLEVECELWMERLEPDVVAVERVFSQANRRTAISTGQAAGVALLVASRRGITVAMHTPTEVKAAVTGSGRAEKKQVAMMVQRILRLESIPKPVDSTDALALAICHLWRGVGEARVREAALADRMRQVRKGAP
jgi:crossover junction endodeoxyribonuclease RuvC